MSSSGSKSNPIFKNEYYALILLIIGVTALLIIRGSLFDYDWGDYSWFILPWINEFRNMTFIEGLGTKVGNYNPPYMYILNIISRTNYSELYLVKSVSMIFDFLLAFFAMKIVSLKTESQNMRVMVFLLVLAIPTVVLNSSMWGQCDSIYSAFAIGSLYFGLKGRSKSAYAFIALAVSFKAQAVFLLPMIPVFIFTKKIRYQDCFMFFVVYLVTLLPAILAGMPVTTALLTYIDQANYFSQLNMNLPNVWRLVDHIDYNSFRTAGLYVAGLAVFGLLYFTFVNRERLISNVDFVRLAYLFAIIMPFLLPKMHDRYYYLADVLSVLVFLFDKRRWYVPVVTVLCSYIAYAYFLMQGITLVDYRLLALALLIVIIIVLRDYVTSLYADTNESVDS